MDFSTIFTTIFTTVAILGLVIGVLTSLIRSSLEKLFSKLTTSFYWREVILPLIPFILGAIIWYLSQKYFDKSILSYHALLGSASSSYFYRLWKSYLTIATTKLDKEANDAIDEANKPTLPPDPKV